MTSLLPLPVYILIRAVELTPLKFLTQTSHTSSKIHYRPQYNQTFILSMNKHFLYGCSTTVNFAKLATLSSVLTVAVT